jgi:mRNA interferase MazF
MTKTSLRQYDIWTADLNPAVGSEPGKSRPIVILQSDILHEAGHSSTIACAVSSQPRKGFSLIRITVVPDASNGLKKRSYILADQIHALDLSRLGERIGRLNSESILMLKESLKAILSI